MSLPLRLLTMRDLIDLFCVTRKTIERWVALGKIPRPIKVGRKNLWREDVVLALVEKLSGGVTTAGCASVR